MTSSLPDIAALSHAVLGGVFGERDAARRLAAIERIFSEDILFIDHNGARHGRAAVAESVAALHARFPDFRFTPASEPQVMDGAARLNWHFGPPSEPGKVTGTTVVVVRDGRIATMLVFLDH